jgi:hypothetical protein
LALGNYDSEKGVFPLVAGGMVNPGAPVEVRIARGRSHQSPISYPGPMKNYCIAGRGNTELATFSLRANGSEKIQSVPMPRREAEAFIGEVGDRYATIELLVETEPDIPPPGYLLDSGDPNL